MNLTEAASLLVRVAPFFAIVITELTGTDFERRLNSVYSDHSAETPLQSPALEDCEDFAQFSFDHQNTVQHLDLTLITLIILFSAQVLRTVGDRTALILSLSIFLVAIIITYAVRRFVNGKLRRQSPHKYMTEDTIMDIRYGTVAVVGSNFFVVFVLLVVEIYLM
jgi:hypothetical protein